MTLRERRTLRASLASPVGSFARRYQTLPRPARLRAPPRCCCYRAAPAETRCDEDFPTPRSATIGIENTADIRLYLCRTPRQLHLRKEYVLCRALQCASARQRKQCWILFRQFHQRGLWDER